jgi:hypothetical protein
MVCMSSGFTLLFPWCFGMYVYKWSGQIYPLVRVGVRYCLITIGKSGVWTILSLFSWQWIPLCDNLLRRVVDILVDCMASQILWKEHDYRNIEWMGNCTYLFHFADLCYLCCYFFKFLTVSPKSCVDSWDFSIQFSYRLSSCAGLWSESIFEFIRHIHFFGYLVDCWEQQNCHLI